MRDFAFTLVKNQKNDTFEEKYFLTFPQMNWTQLLEALKSATSTENFDNIPDSKYYSWLSRSHERIAEYIKAKIDSKFFMAIAQADIISGQSLYDNIGLNQATGRYINVIDALYVKYDWVNFKKLEIRDLSEMPESREYYQANQSKDDPFCVITGQRVLLFPVPTIDVLGGMEVIGSRNVPEITSSTTDSQIFNGVLKEYHDMIVLWAKQYVYEHLQEFSKYQLAKWEFDNIELPWMRAEISFRWSQPIHYQEPNFTSLLN